MLTRASNGTRLLGGMTIAGMVPVIVAVALSAIFMIQPWVNVPLAGLSGALLGEGAAIRSDYSVLDLFNLISTLLSGQSYLNGGAGVTSTDFMEMAIVYGYMVLWASGIVLPLVGTFKLYRDGNKTMVIVGGCLAALAALIFIFVCQQAARYVADRSYGISVLSPTKWPYAAVASGAITAFLGYVARVAPTHASASSPSIPSTSGRSNASRQNVTPPEPVQPADTTTAYCTCPACGSTVRAKVPRADCMVNITCSNCRTKFPMEVKRRS